MLCVLPCHPCLLNEGSDDTRYLHDDNHNEEGSVDKEDDLGDDVVGADGGNEPDHANRHHHKAKDDEHNGNVKGRAGDNVNIASLCRL